jgi:hypothetical protein
MKRVDFKGKNLKIRRQGSERPGKLVRAGGRNCRLKLRVLVPLAPIV